MDNLKKEYDEIIELRNRIIKEMKVLEENESIKRYFELEKQNKSLYANQLRLFTTMKEQEYDSCSHILVFSKIEHDRWEGRTDKSSGCIKCGLDNSVLDCDRRYLPFDKEIMYNYFKKKRGYSAYLTGIETKIACNLDLAQAIYRKIKIAHPNIDDETAIQYFKNALDNIRNVNVSEERKESRAKRLSLNPSFKSWNGRDVHVG